jgi:hypothetical protein
MERNSIIRFEVFMAVTMKNAIFWDVMPCGSCNNQCYGGAYCLHASMLPLPVTANIVPSSLILVTLMMEAIRSSETSVLTRATRHNIQKMAFFKFQCV